MKSIRRWLGRTVNQDPTGELTNMMRNFAKAACAIASMLVYNSGAQAIELDGAWVSPEGICSNVLVKRGNTTSISKNADNYGRAFIIRGDRITGKLARCTIKSRKPNGPLLHLHLNCSTDVAFQDVQFSVKSDGENKIIRVFPELPELDTTYFRCPL